MDTQRTTFVQFLKLKRQRETITAAHIGFEAASRKAVNAFFTAALTAGGRSHGEPASRDPDGEYYSAAVLDFDDNSIEVVHRLHPSHTINEREQTCDNRSVLAWQKKVAMSEAPASGRPQTERSTAHVYVNNVAKPSVVVTQTVPATAVSNGNQEKNTKALIGTLLGAAAGAAVAYAMTKAEAQDANNEAATHTITYRTVEHPGAPSQSNPEQASQECSSRRPCSLNGTDLSCRTPIRALNYPQVDRSTVSQSEASFISSTRRNYTKSKTPPRLVNIPASTFIETFIPPSEVPRYPQMQLARHTHADVVLASSPTIASQPSKRSRSSHASSAAETVIAHGQVPKATHSPPSEGIRSAVHKPLPSSKATSVVSRRTGDKEAREGASHPVIAESIAPSDSISQVGSMSRRSKASKRSSRLKSDISAPEVHSRVSSSTVQGPSSKTRDGRGGSAASLPMRPSSKVSAHRSVKSFITGV